jgi:hypothetical protein
VYNVTPDVDKAGFLVISQVGEYCIRVSLTLTSTSMREEPTAQQAEGKPAVWTFVPVSLLVNKSLTSLIKLTTPSSVGAIIWKAMQQYDNALSAR